MEGAADNSLHTDDGGLEWVFSIRSGADDSSSIVQLHSTKSKVTSSTDTEAWRTPIPLSSPLVARSSSPQTPPPETASLLEKDELATVSSGGGTGMNATIQQQRQREASIDVPCWTFIGPDWQVISRVLLEVTYRPAWQALLSYTSMSFSRDVIKRSCTCKKPKKPVHFFTRTYKTGDIHHTEEISEHFNVRGIGLCRGMRVYFRHQPQENLPPIPNSKTHIELSQQWNLNDHDDGEWNRFQREPADSLASPIDNNHEKEGIGPVLTFAMPLQQVDYDHGPPLLWKVHLPPYPDLALETITVLDGLLSNHDPTHIYINGYQSWSFSGSVVKGDPQPASAMPEFISGSFNKGGEVPPTKNVIKSGSSIRSYFQCGTGSSSKECKGYSSDFFTCITSDGAVPSSSKKNRREARNDTLRQFPYRALDETGGPALILGWLSQHRHNGLITADPTLTFVEMHASADAQILRHETETDWAYLQVVAPHSYDEEPMAHYLHAVAAHNVARPLQNGPLLTGWCSWYHYYEKIDGWTLNENFGKLARMRSEIPTNVAVVDDGYMTAWGDWDSLKPGKFSPDGMKAVADSIRANGMKPGLWLAPFACDKGSKVYQQHPDWVIRSDEGRNANSSFCGKFFLPLDITNPHVREHAYSCVRRAVVDWGFEVLKIDFLYAGCINGTGKYDLGMTRAEAMHLGLQTIRAAAGPDVFLIGCGCPIGPAIGYIDGMRVSADTGPTWVPTFPLPSWDNGTLPALRAMIRNTISRAPLGHRWWHNDPDCLLLGETTKLTEAEVSSAASIIAMTCGMLLLSDDLSLLSERRKQIACKIFPLTGASAVVLDLHSTNDGLPSILRLWCTDRYSLMGFNSMAEDQDPDRDHNKEATLFARRASFDPDAVEAIVPSERKRNCVHVVKGLGTWTLLSVSNWTSSPATIHVPPMALLPHPEHGWEVDDIAEDPQHDHGSISVHGLHVFGFWSGSYQWIRDPRDSSNSTSLSSVAVAEGLSRHLDTHATEIFHIKKVQPGLPEYIGSDLHFSCGHEVRSINKSRDLLKVQLRRDYRRSGYVFLFLPIPKVDEISVLVAGAIAEYASIGSTRAAVDPTVCIGRVIRVRVEVQGDGQLERDGEIVVKF